MNEPCRLRSGRRIWSLRRRYRPPKNKMPFFAFELLNLHDEGHKTGIPVSSCKGLPVSEMVLAYGPIIPYRPGSFEFAAGHCSARVREGIRMDHALAPHAPDPGMPTGGRDFSSPLDETRSAPAKGTDLVWSEWRDSNSRPPAPKAGALPTGQHPDLYAVNLSGPNAGALPGRKQVCSPLWLQMRPRRICLTRPSTLPHLPFPGLAMASARQWRGCGDGGFAASAPGGAKPPSQLGNTRSSSRTSHPSLPQTQNAL